MFANVSPLWRKRLRLVVVAWAALLIAAAFLGREATVREQAGAAEGRRAADAAVGVAASALAGEAFSFAVGAPSVTECDLTPVRKGVSYLRAFEVRSDEPELAFRQAVGAMAPHLAAQAPDPGVWHWRATSPEFVTATLDLGEGGAEPALYGSVTSGCRPAEAETGAVTPGERPGWITLAEAHPGLDAAGAAVAAYGRVECARGGEVVTWWWDAGGEALVPSTVDGCD